jgi:hypothetical protein
MLRSFGTEMLYAPHLAFKEKHGHCDGGHTSTFLLEHYRENVSFRTAIFLWSRKALERQTERTRANPLYKPLPGLD